MNRNAQTLILIAVGLAALAGGITAFNYGAPTSIDSPEQMPKHTVGKPDPSAAAFLQTDVVWVNADQVTTNGPVSPNKRQAVLINFWATWCAPCIEEMPALSELSKRYPNVRFVGIGVDSESKVREFTRKTPIHFPVTASNASAIQWARELGNDVGGLPFTLLVDANGRIQERIEGSIDLNKLEIWLKNQQ